MMMLAPAFGEVSVSTRIRLAIALAVAGILTPLVASSYPEMPVTVLPLFKIIGGEILIGLLIGALMRFVTAALQVAGQVIAFQTSLGFAQNVDPTQGVQGAIISTFLSVVGITLIFVTDLHHLILHAIRDSYVLFPPNTPFPIGDFTNLAISSFANAFKLGVQMAAPFVLFGLVFYLGIGILSKLMPQVQIFFIAVPANILLGFAILALTLSTMMMWYLSFFEQFLVQFVV